MLSETAKRLVVLAFVGCLLVAAGCVVASWDKPIVGDLIVYSWWARGVMQQGVPAVQWNPDEPVYPGNLHAPTYPYLLALGYSVFGDRPRSAMLVNVACLLGTVALLRALCRRLFPEAATPATLLVLAIVFIHPFAVQSLLLTDTDTTLVPLGIFGYALLLLASLEAMGPRRVVALGLVFGATLWTKFSTPLILPVVTCLFLALRGQPREAARWSAAIGAIGLGFWAATDFLFSRLTGLAPFAMAGWASQKAQGEVGMGLGARLVEVSATLKTDLVWFGLPFLTLVALASATRLAEWVRTRRVRPLDFFALLGLLIYAFYTVVIPTAGIPRYKSVTLPLFALVVGDFLLGQLRAARLDRRTLGVAGVALAAGLAYYSVLPEVVATATRLSALDRSVMPKLALMGAFAAPLVLGAALVAAWQRRPGRSALTWAAAVSFVALAVVTDVKQARAESPHNFFGIGQRGFAETVAYLRAHAAPDELFFSYKDVPYYTGHQYYLYFRFQGPIRVVDVDRLGPILERRNVGWWIVEESPIRFGDVRIEGEARAFLDGHFQLAARFGDFHVYKRRPARFASQRPSSER